MKRYKVSKEAQKKDEDYRAKTGVLDTLAKTMKAKNESYIESKLFQLSKELIKEREDFWALVKKELQIDSFVNLTYDGGAKEVSIISKTPNALIDILAEGKNMAIELKEYAIASQLRGLEMEYQNESDIEVKRD